LDALIFDISGSHIKKEEKEEKKSDRDLRHTRLRHPRLLRLFLVLLSNRLIEF